MTYRSDEVTQQFCDTGVMRVRHDRGCIYGIRLCTGYHGSVMLP